jgi:hypothetical protein
MFAGAALQGAGALRYSREGSFDMILPPRDTRPFSLTDALSLAVPSTKTFQLNWKRDARIAGSASFRA